jgi:hypothetical protein
MKSPAAVPAMQAAATVPRSGVTGTVSGCPGAAVDAITGQETRHSRDDTVQAT